jgi:hypothetical protein
VVSRRLPPEGPGADGGLGQTTQKVTDTCDFCGEVCHENLTAALKILVENAVTFHQRES